MSTKMVRLLPQNSQILQKEDRVPLSKVTVQRPPAKTYVRAQEPTATPFVIKPLEINEQGKVVMCSPRSRLYQVLWITGGCGAYKVGMESYALHPYTLVFLAPSGVHQVQPVTSLSGVVIGFQADMLTLDMQYQQSLLPLLFRQSVQSLCVTVADNEAEQIHYIVGHLEQEFHVHQPGQLAMVQACLRILLTTLCRLTHLSEQEERQMPPLVQTFLSLVERHIYDKKQVSDYAEMLAVTPGYLNQVVKQYLGKTAGEILREGVLQEAKRMLMFSGTSVNEIAHHFAFEDPSYFCRFFRRSTGQSPKAFQRAMQQIS